MSSIPVAITVVASLPIVPPVTFTVATVSIPTPPGHTARASGAGRGIRSRGRERGWGKPTLLALFLELLEHAAEFVIPEVHLDESDVRHI